MLLIAILTNYVPEKTHKELPTPDRRSVTLEFFKNRVEDSVLLRCYVTSNRRFEGSLCHLFQGQVVEIELSLSLSSLSLSLSLSLHIAP